MFKKTYITQTHHTNKSHKHTLYTILTGNIHTHIPVGFSHFIDTPDAPAALRDQRLCCYIACFHLNVHTCAYICTYKYIRQFVFIHIFCSPAQPAAPRLYCLHTFKCTYMCIYMYILTYTSICVHTYVLQPCTTSNSAAILLVYI